MYNYILWVIFLKQVVLSLKDESEARLRRLAQKTRGGRKGALSETVDEALYLLEKKLKQQSSLVKLKELAGKENILVFNDVHFV